MSNGYNGRQMTMDCLSGIGAHSLPLTRGLILISEEALGAGLPVLFTAAELGGCCCCCWTEDGAAVVVLAPMPLLAVVVVVVVVVVVEDCAGGCLVLLSTWEWAPPGALAGGWGEGTGESPPSAFSAGGDGCVAAAS